MGTASLLASTAPPPYLESFLAQRAPVWLNFVWSNYSLEIFCLPGISDLHLYTFLFKCCRTQHAAKSRNPTWRDRNTHSHVILFHTSCHIPSTHQKQSYFIQEFLPSLHPPSLLWQDTIPKEFHRAEPVLWLFCLKNPAVEINGVDIFFKVATACCSHWRRKLALSSGPCVHTEAMLTPSSKSLVGYGTGNLPGESRSHR